MLEKNSLLFFVVCCISGYVSASDSSCLAPARKKSVTEQQLAAVRKVDRAKRAVLFGCMRDGIPLATIPEKTCLRTPLNQSASNPVSLQAVATREETSLKEKPSFAPLYKGVCHTLSPSGKQPISLLDRVLTALPFQPDQEHSKNQLRIDESD